MSYSNHLTALTHATAVAKKLVQSLKFADVSRSQGIEPWILQLADDLANVGAKTLDHVGPRGSPEMAANARLPKEVLDEFESFVRSDLAVTLRCLLLDVLALWGGESSAHCASEVVKATLEHPQRNLPLAALHALFVVGGPDAGRLLFQLSSDENTPDDVRDRAGRYYNELAIGGVLDPAFGPEPTADDRDPGSDLDPIRWTVAPETWAERWHEAGKHLGHELYQAALDVWREARPKLANQIHGSLTNELDTWWQNSGRLLDDWQAPLEQSIPYFWVGIDSKLLVHEIVDTSLLEAADARNCHLRVAPKWELYSLPSDAGLPLPLRWIAAHEEPASGAAGNIASWQRGLELWVSECYRLPTQLIQDGFGALAFAVMIVQHRTQEILEPSLPLPPLVEVIRHAFHPRRVWARAPR